MLVPSRGRRRAGWSQAYTYHSLPHGAELALAGGAENESDDSGRAKHFRWGGLLRRDLEILALSLAAVPEPSLN